MALRLMTNYELTKEDHLCAWLVEADHPPGDSRECGERASHVVETLSSVAVYYHWYCQEHATAIRRFINRKLN